MSAASAEMPGEAVVRPLTVADVPELVRVHRAAFASAALTRLGPETVRRYYEWQLAAPHDQWALGVWSGGRLAAFGFGGVFRGALSGFLRDHRGHLFRAVARRPWLALDPIFRTRLSTGVRRLVRPPPPPPPGAITGPRPFGMLVLATDPAAQGRGFGGLLLREMEVRARAAGFRRMELTVHASNERAIRLYERLGWRRSRTDPPGGGWRMYLPLGERDGSETS
jgi:ribosomal protein S18 acetylase RimI-like enzyme